MDKNGGKKGIKPNIKDVINSPRPGVIKGIDVSPVADTPDGGPCLCSDITCACQTDPGDCKSDMVTSVARDPGRDPGLTNLGGIAPQGFATIKQGIDATTGKGKAPKK